MRRSLIFALAAAAAVLAGCSSPTVGQAQTQTQPSKPATRDVDTIVWEGFGGAPRIGVGGLIAYSYKGDVNKPGTTATAGLPFRHTDTLTHQDWQLQLRVSGLPDEEVTCSITVNDEVVAKKSGTGWVDCNWTA